MIKQLLVVRKDLNMRKGKIAAQCCHASMKIFFDRMSRIGSCDETNSVSYCLTVKADMQEWIEGAFTKVVVGCDSLEELIELKDKAVLTGLPTALIIDNGATEFDNVMTTTCLAIGPADAKIIDTVTSHLKLI